MTHDSQYRNAAGTGLMMRWGLIPWFAKGTPPHYSTINATIENLERGAAWRGPWSRAQRCIMPAAAFYEWHMGENGEKNPFLIKLADQELFGFVALWDCSAKPDGTVIESCALITMPGNELMRHVHNTGAHPFRMPGAVQLAPSLQDLLRPPHPVSQPTVSRHVSPRPVHASNGINRSQLPQRIPSLPFLSILVTLK